MDRNIETREGNNKKKVRVQWFRAATLKIKYTDFGKKKKNLIIKRREPRKKYKRRCSRETILDEN